jgi:alpha-tubulin suppressor-like RCC1 family protein
LLANGTVTCWGFNEAGQLGNTTGVGAFPGPGDNPTPTVVAGLSGVTQIAAGDGETCALLGNRTVSCWGSGDYGELGPAVSDTGPHPTPTPVTGLTGVLQVIAGDGDTCVLLANHTVSCWGFNLEGELGNPTNIGNSSAANPNPTTVAGLSGVIQITEGEEFTCALLANHTVTCWGFNGSGQLGNTTNIGTDNPNPTPTAVAGLSGVTQIVAGSDHMCALLAYGTVTCWGANFSGQLGNATGVGNFANPGGYPTPTVVAGLSGVTQIAAGYVESCGILINGTATCWGSGSPTPTTVPALGGVTHIVLGASPQQERSPALYQCASLVDGTVSCSGDNLYGELGNNGTGGPVVGIP